MPNIVNNGNLRKYIKQRQGRNKKTLDDNNNENNAIW